MLYVYCPVEVQSSRYLSCSVVQPTTPPGMYLPPRSSRDLIHDKPQMAYGFMLLFMSLALQCPHELYHSVSHCMLVLPRIDSHTYHKCPDFWLPLLTSNPTLLDAPTPLACTGCAYSALVTCCARWQELVLPASCSSRQKGQHDISDQPPPVSHPGLQLCKEKGT
jgi:hypothetical protein